MEPREINHEKVLVLLQKIMKLEKENLSQKFYNDPEMIRKIKTILEGEL